MDKNILLPSFRLGLLIGIVGMVIAQLLYLANEQVFVQAHTMCAFIVAFILVCYCGRKERDTQHNGFLNFQSSFFFSLIALFSSYFIYQAHFILMCNFQYPEIQSIILDTTLKASETMLDLLATPIDEQDKQLEILETEIKNGFKPFNLLQQSWTYLSISAFFSIFIALIIKKSKPDFE